MSSPLEVLTAEQRAILHRTEALLEGHFVLTSGLHSPYYLQAMRLLQHPQISEEIARIVLSQVSVSECDAVLSPAIGGIVWGYELARQLNARAIFAERADGRLTLRRGFALREDERVLIAEDVTTTGGTVEELRSICFESGAVPMGIAAVVDRSGGAYSPDIPFAAWVRLAIPTWSAEECPLCAAGGVPVKPGSRKIPPPPGS